MGFGAVELTVGYCSSVAHIQRIRDIYTSGKALIIKLSKMKRQLEGVVMRESKYRRVKKVTEPKFPYWNLLPNEIKAMILQELDLETSLSFRRCGPNEAELVRKHTKHSVNIIVKYLKKSEESPEKMEIELNDKQCGKWWVYDLKWFIYRHSDGGTKVLNPSFAPKVVIMRKTNFEAAVSNILRRLLTDPMFVVNEFQLELGVYDQKIDLGSISAHVKTLVLYDCLKTTPVFSMLEDKKLNFEKFLGTSWSIIFQFDHLTYGRPRSLPKGVSFSRDLPTNYRFWACRNMPGHYQNFIFRLKLFWDSTFGSYRIRDRNVVENTLEQKKTINDIACLHAAYCYDSYNHDTCCDYDGKVTFLRDGIDVYLTDYQLMVLYLAYLARLFRNEPEIEKVYDIAHEDLRHVVKKFEVKNASIYEKLVAKLEALLP